MMSPQFQTIAQIVIGRILNSLPEGVLVALFAWVTLRLLPRQNSGTRFAVWFVALLAVAGLPLIGSIVGPRFLQAASGGHPLITLPGPWGALLLLAWVLAVSAGMLRLAVGLWRVQAPAQGLRSDRPRAARTCGAKNLGRFLFVKIGGTCYFRGRERAFSPRLRQADDCHSSLGAAENSRPRN